MEVGVTRVATLINPDVGDLALDEKGEVVVLTTLREETAQRIFVRLNFMRHEWFLNLDEGVPYYERILGKVSERVVRSIFSQVIAGTQGVAEVTRLTYSLGSDRRLRLVFEARLSDGSVLNSNDFAPFIVVA